MTDKNAQQALEALKLAFELIDNHTFATPAQCDQVAQAIAAIESAAPSAAEPVASPCQFAIDHGGNLYRRYGAPVCASCVPAKKTTDKWDSARIDDYNRGWNECVDAMLSAAPPAPQAASEPVATQAARDVLAERQRQISTEGYTPEHDDEHGAEEFGRAASVYANSHVYDVIGASYMGWPWDEAWYKPTTQRRNFVKAAALLLAGIECIDRATLPNGLTEAETSATASVAWLPTSENINALPEPVRDYIHSLIANCDPAGNVADNAIKADTIRALEASNRRIRDELDTPGNRNPEARYAGYRGEPALERYTADELAAWEEGQRARVPASVAGLSGDAEREALTEERPRAPKAFREPEPGTPWWQTAKDCGAWTDRGEGDLGYVHFGSVEALRVFAGKIARQAEAALHSTGKPDGEVASEPVVPFLARDVAELLGISVPELSAALMAHGMPARSQGMTIGPLEALAVRRTIAANADAPVAESMATPVGEVVSMSRGWQKAAVRMYPCAANLRTGTQLYTRPPAPEEGKDAALAEARHQLLNTPELHNFSEGVTLEALHQRERWGTSHDGGKAPADWFWLVGYLAGKALHAQTSGNTDKALHHTISTAAALANWHAAITGTSTAMRPGIAPPADAALSQGGGA